MKKLIAGSLMIFGTVLISAQITPPQDTTRARTEKKINKKTLETVQPNGTNRTVDTANLDKRQKIEDNRTIKRAEPTRDGLNNEASKPSPSQPVPGKLE
jgi:hypothetical protein